MNHLSAAQNIFIGREPRGLLGVFLDENALNEQARRIFETMHLRLDPPICVGTLSVAKQQLVEIAKALSFDSRVLIMDEPTAALDARAEHALFSSIRGHAAGRSVLLITHRLASVKHADRIYVLRDGQVIEQGEHTDLIALGGQYAELFTLQAAQYHL